MTSRKYKSAWILTIIFLVLLVVPTVTTFVLTLLGTPVAFSIISPEMFVTFITLIWSAYFGANILQKKFIGTREIEPDDEDNDGFGGQPADVDNP